MTKPEVRFSVSPQFIDYLRWLVDNTVLGDTTNEVAKHILTRQLSEMRDEGFKDSPDED